MPRTTDPDSLSLKPSTATVRGERARPDFSGVRGTADTVPATDGDPQASDPSSASTTPSSNGVQRYTVKSGRARSPRTVAVDGLSDSESGSVVRGMGDGPLGWGGQRPTRGVKKASRRRESRVDIGARPSRRSPPRDATAGQRAREARARARASPARG